MVLASPSVGSTVDQNPTEWHTGSLNVIRVSLKLLIAVPFPLYCRWAQYVGYTTKRPGSDEPIISPDTSHNHVTTRSLPPTTPYPQSAPKSTPVSTNQNSGWPVVIDPEPIAAYDQDLGLNAELEYSFIKGMKWSIDWLSIESWLNMSMTM